MQQGLFENKVDVVIERLKIHEPPEGYYGATSFGKDSIVIMDLVKKSGVKCDWHFNITTVDPPELLRFGKQFKDVIWEKPEINMWNLIVKKRMPPTRKVRYCCEYFKERGGHGRVVLTGIRWSESSRRSKRRMVEGCFKDGKITYLHPIIDWSESDVWEYIKENNLLYCSLYSEGFKRIGCIMCPMKTQKEQKIDAIRWPHFRENYVKSFQRCVDKRIIDGLKTEWKTGQEMYDWWIKNSTKPDKNQMNIFE